MSCWKTSVVSDTAAQASAGERNALELRLLVGSTSGAPTSVVLDAPADAGISQRLGHLHGLIGRHELVLGAG